MKWKSALGVAAIFIAIPALLFAGADSAQAMVQQGALQSATDASESFLARLGGWAYLLAPLLMIVVAILPIPAEFPAMMNALASLPQEGVLPLPLQSYELTSKRSRRYDDQHAGDPDAYLDRPVSSPGADPSYQS